MVTPNGKERETGTVKRARMCCSGRKTASTPDRFVVNEITDLRDERNAVTDELLIQKVNDACSARGRLLLVVPPLGVCHHPELPGAKPRRRTDVRKRSGCQASTTG
jgi:hypothetical protein